MYLKQVQAVFIVLVVLLVGAFVSTHVTRDMSDLQVGGGFISSEVNFADASQSGLSIVPASCPSSPNYAGECDVPPVDPGGQKCAMSASPYTVNLGQSATLYWKSNDLSNTYISGGTGQVVGAVPANGTAVVTPQAKTTYVMSGTYEFSDKNGTHTVYMYCDSTISVIAPPCTIPATLSADGKGYVLSPGQTERKIMVSGAMWCVSNQSGNTYFIPANTAAETLSFLNSTPSLPGVTKHQ